MHAEATVYVTQRGREDDDFAAYVYKSTDSGRTFQSISSNLPPAPVNVIREDPRNPNVLYVGTDFGVFVSTNGGNSWEVLGANLPSVQVSDLQFHTRDRVIVASTYGRGMWVFDAQPLAAAR
jgi:ligand-binding sensor domain-containing protein